MSSPERAGNPGGGVVACFVGGIRRRGAFKAFELTGASWIVFPKGCPFRKSNEAWLSGEGIAAPNMIEISTLETMLSRVRAKLVKALLPASAIPWSDPGLRAYPVPEEYRATTRLLRRNESFRERRLPLSRNASESGRSEFDWNSGLLILKTSPVSESLPEKGGIFS